MEPRYDYMLNVKEIRRIAREKGLNKVDIALALGVSTKTLDTYLKHPDRIRLYHVAKLATVLENNRFKQPEDFCISVERKKD